MAQDLLTWGLLSPWLGVFSGESPPSLVLLKPRRWIIYCTVILSWNASALAGPLRAVLKATCLLPYWLLQWASCWPEGKPHLWGRREPTWSPPSTGTVLGISVTLLISLKRQGYQSPACTWGNRPQEIETSCPRTQWSEVLGFKPRLIWHSWFLHCCVYGITLLLVGGMGRDLDQIGFLTLTVP